jgi:NhaA family Na+:H+ antiporter
VALAIVDDLGAVVVIALFYTAELRLDALAVAAAFFGILIVLNRMGVRRPWPYFLVGVFLWVAMLESGVHATLAGILTAWSIPARPKFHPKRFSDHVRALMERFDRSCIGEPNLLRNEEQRGIVQALENGVHMVEAPLQRLEHSMHIPVAFFVIPVFALANAGVPIRFAELHVVAFDPIALGVILGLIVGKLTGIAGLSLLAIRLGIGMLPEGAQPRHLVGVGLIAGIGFTMSIFIAELAFAGQTDALIVAKTGVILASLISGVLGYLWLRLGSPNPAQDSSHLRQAENS